MIEVEINNEAVRRALERLQNVSGHVDTVLLEIGEVLAESTKNRFGTLTGPDGKRWKDNSPVTIERKGRNQPLTQHGTLAEQILAQLIEPDTLMVGSPMEYAAMQQFGGTEEEFPHLWGDIPARPFIGISDDDRDEVVDLIQDYIESSLR
jgi:phage virion morphogenesis protein